MNDPTEPADDPRMTWGLIIDVLDVLERHGYHKSDDRHTGAVVGYLLPLAQPYAGERDELNPAKAAAS
jgi:hypothetical protein